MMQRKKITLKYIEATKADKQKTKSTSDLWSASKKIASKLALL